MTDALFTHTSGYSLPNAPIAHWKKLRREMLFRLKLDLLLYDRIYFPTSEILTDKTLFHLLNPNKSELYASGDETDIPKETALAIQSLFQEGIFRLVAFENPNQDNPIKDITRILLSNPEIISDITPDQMKEHRDTLCQCVKLKDFDFWGKDEDFRGMYKQNCEFCCDTLIDKCSKEESQLAYHAESIKNYINSTDKVTLSNFYRLNENINSPSDKILKESLNVLFKYRYTTTAVGSWTRERNKNENNIPIWHCDNHAAGMTNFIFTTGGGINSHSPDSEIFSTDISLIELVKKARLSQIIEIRNEGPIRAFRKLFSQRITPKEYPQKLEQAHKEAVVFFEDWLDGKDITQKHTILKKACKMIALTITPATSIVILLSESNKSAGDYLKDIATLTSILVLYHFGKTTSIRPTSGSIALRSQLQELIEYRNRSAYELLPMLNK